MAPRPLALLLLAVWAAGTGAAPLPEGCEQELNKIKDLLQVSCEGRGLTGPPSGLPPETGILLLSGNRLEPLSLAAFEALRNLTELDVANNSLAALLPPDAPLPALQQLGLASNALRSLPDLRGLPALRRLVLARNALDGLPDGGFRALPALQDLELQGNRLRDLPPGAFAGLAQLRDLDLSDNQLEALPQELLDGLEALAILRLERNRLRSVPDGFFQELLLAYVYLHENPWSCDCRLRYLRDWISENDLSVYTRQQGPHKETTEHDPEGVTCSAPPEQKGRPVVHFQAACRDPGDGGGASEEEGATTPARPSTAAPTALSSPAPPTTSTARTSTAPTATLAAPTPPSSPASTTTTVRLSTDASTAPTSTAPTTTPGAPTALSSPAPPTTSTARTSTAPTATLAAPTPPSSPASTTTTVRLSTDASTAPTSTAPTTTPGAPTPPSSPALTTLASPTPPSSPAPSTTLAAPPSPSSPAPTTTLASPTPPSSPAPSTTPARPSTAAPTATGRTWLLPSTGGVGLLRSTPAGSLWGGPTAPPARCLCPAVPLGALQAPTGRGSPASRAGRLSALCCPLRLALYAACLVLAGLPVLLGGCCCCCGARAELSGRLPSRSPGPGRASAFGGGQRGNYGAAGPVAERRLYYVCKEFQLAPATHVAWLLVSLPGRRRRPSPGAPSPSGVGGAGASAS